MKHVDASLLVPVPGTGTRTGAYACGWQRHAIVLLPNYWWPLAVLVFVPVLVLAHVLAPARVAVPVSVFCLCMCLCLCFCLYLQLPV